ncbi:MAG: ribosome small subunit-dependent GTPase A [Lachnospiraceae bacterium]|nr:ribosome small subunit-dependent GTPase A [Lachnospiraceae bacterium]MBR4795811.1 ribosome small subunit-dependent GTPase A [Lachnospiraceae bacterium]MBR5789338.1 ribosome small subunit-dependent GTPase A [Lachnospiraceae bacterium]
MQGKIIKGIAGFYYVHVAESGIYECKAKGIFRKNNEKPIVGDDCIIEVISEEEKTGNISELLPRRNELLRPTVSNVDQALVVFACKSPDINYNLLDRFLIRMQMEGIPTIMVFNKVDLVSDEEKAYIAEVYERAGNKILFTSTKSQEGIEELKEILRNKTSTVAGPSGVGKSSIVNLLQSNVYMETGSISNKIERGKHTTRHSEIIPIEQSTYIVDTPGFSTLYISELMEEELKNFYPDFEVENRCRFDGCNHIKEPDCAVKAAVESGLINKDRYENYVLLFEELKNTKRY